MRAAAPLLALLLACASCAAPPSEDAAAADSFAAPRLSPAGELVRRGDAHFERGDLSGARALYAQAIKTSGGDEVYVEACAQLARIELASGSPTEGEAWLRMAGARAAVSAPRGWSRLQLVVALYELEEGQVEVAAGRLAALYDYCLDARLFERALDAARRAARLGQSQEEQLEWARKGIAAAEAGGLYLELAGLWTELGERLRAEGRERDASFAFEEAQRYRDAAEESSRG